MQIYLHPSTASCSGRILTSASASHDNHIDLHTYIYFMVSLHMPDGQQGYGQRKRLRGQTSTLHNPLITLYVTNVPTASTLTPTTNVLRFRDST